MATLAVTLAANITSGDRLVVEVGMWSGAGSRAASVTDSAGNQYVELLHFAASEATEMSVWTAPITVGGGTRPTITVQPTSPADIGVAALEYAGLSTVSDATVVDQMARASGTTGGAASVASGATAATAAGNELAMGFYVDSGFGDALTADPTYTLRTNVSPTSDVEFVAEDRIVSGGATPNATVLTGASTTWLMATVVFKAGVAGPPTAPAAPTGVNASAGNASATVSWTAPSNGGSPITSYTVTPFVGTTAQPATTVSGSPPATSVTITGLTNGTSYTFTVRATNAVGPGPASSASNAVTPAAAPSAPTGVSATAGNASATVTWTAPANGGSPITSYTVTPFIGSTAQPTTTVSGFPPATSATISGLANGTTYTFTVAATNAIGTGPPSSRSNAVTPAGTQTVPSAPTGVNATAGNASATVTWTAPANGGSPIMSYTVTPYVGTVAQAPTTVLGSPPATTTTITGLTNGTSYTFTVSATNAVGPGPASSASNPVIPTAAGVPGFVQGFSGHAHGVGSLALTPTSNVTSGNRLVVEVGIWNSVSATAASVTDSAGNQYVELLHFAASEATEMSVWTAPITVGGGTRPTITVQPTSPADIGVAVLEYAGLSTVSDATVVDQMARASGTTGGAASVASGATAATAAGNELAMGFYVDSGFGDALTADPTYTLRTNVSPTSDVEFVAEDRIVSGGATPNATVLTGASTTWLMATVVFKAGVAGPPTAPAAPTGVTASAGNASATVSWTAPSNGGSPITSYTVTPYVGATAQTATTVSGSPPATSVAITGLVNGTTYTFTVAASNAIGSGPPSSASNPVTPGVPVVPGAPTGVSATAGNGSATMSWSAPSNGGSPITSYTVTPYVGTTAQTATTVSGSPPATTTTITGLTNGTSYTFKVIATNAVGPGPASSASNSVTPTATPIAYPDLQVQIPTNAISIVHPSSTTRQLSYSHITWNAGTGPWELRPNYDPSTGIAKMSQALYTATGPAQWAYVSSVPIVVPMAYDAALQKYRFPLGTFGLYTVATNGGVGSLVSASPKAEYCMLEDVFVGGVPNAPAVGAYPPTSCGVPTANLGLSVGYGDQYDYLDPGQAIDITNVPDGTYWLRAQVDPYHYLLESDLSNNLTDTKLTISGNTVTVITQINPDSTPPSISVTNPASGSTVSGTVVLQSAVGGPASVVSVQYMLDGSPIGSPVTSAPSYSFNWSTAGMSPGSHLLSAQATDSNGFIRTASGVPVTVAGGAATLSTSAPTVVFANLVDTQIVTGTTPVAVNASYNVDVSSVQLLLDGKPLGPALTSAPLAYPWDTTGVQSGRHQLSAQAIDASGNVGTAPPITVTVANPMPPMVCYTVDVNQSAHGRGPVTVTGLHTGATGELLLAFVGSDGPASGSQFMTVSGAGLNWTLVQRANKSRGDAEIWQAIATNILTSGWVTATPEVPGFDASLTVIAVQGTGGVGAVATASASSGAPHVALTTTRANSMVFGVGNDWDSAMARTPGFDQVLLNQWQDKRGGNTFWSQNTALPNSPSGSRVALNDTAPKSDQWNFVAVEVLADDG